MSCHLLISITNFFRSHFPYRKVPLVNGHPHSFFFPEIYWWVISSVTVGNRTGPAPILLWFCCLVLGFVQEWFPVCCLWRIPIPCFLPQPPKYWDSKSEPPHLDKGIIDRKSCFQEAWLWQTLYPGWLYQEWVVRRRKLYCSAAKHTWGSWVKGLIKARVCGWSQGAIQWQERPLYRLSGSLSWDPIFYPPVFIDT